MVFSVVIYVLLFITTYFEVFLLVTYFRERNKFKETKPSPRAPEKYPSVTIMVPAWNEEKTISGTVNSLLQLDYPKNLLNIFIVDDGSTDKTFEVANGFLNEPQVKVFRKENGGKYTALNLGLSHATSELVGCLDADSFISPNALHEMVPYFDDLEVMAVTPSVQIHKPHGVLQRLQAIEYMVGAFTRKVFSRIDGLYVTPGPFSIYRRTVFEKIGLFAHGYDTEDMEMALRMQSNHMRIENAHTALVYTVGPRTLPSLLRQRIRWSSGFLKNSFFNYRHMFFNKRFGNLGLLTMPFAFISIFVGLVFSALYAKSILSSIFERYVQFSALGFRSIFHAPSLDWFAINFGFRNLIIYLLLFVTFSFVFIGMKMVIRKFRFSRDVVYFILLYGIISPFWLAVSVYNLITATEARWR